MKLPPRFDLVLAALMTQALVAFTLAVEGADPPGAGAAALALVMGAGVWWRRRVPVAAGLAIAAASGLYELVTEQAAVALLAPLLLGFYSMGAYAPLARAAAGLVAGLALTFLGFLGDSPSLGAWLENIGFAGVVAGSTWSAGIVVRVNRARTEKLAELAAQLEREREQKARLAVAAERVRIARELHDVVAHAISVIAVQAGAGRHAPPTDPHDAFEAIESTARRALVEMRRLLGLLRSGDDPASAAPLPGLQDRGELIEQARVAGLAVSLDVKGEERPLPAGIDLAAYRVLQEALTNVRKHAPGARAEVRIRYGTSELELEIRDDGAGDAAVHTVSSNGGGHGLIGMRERVALYGGEVEATPLPEGGFRVRVRLPLAEDRA